MPAQKDFTVLDVYSIVNVIMEEIAGQSMDCVNVLQDGLVLNAVKVISFNLISSEKKFGY